MYYYYCALTEWICQISDWLWSPQWLVCVSSSWMGQWLDIFVLMTTVTAVFFVMK